MTKTIVCFYSTVKIYPIRYFNLYTFYVSLIFHSVICYFITDNIQFFLVKYDPSGGGGLWLLGPPPWIRAWSQISVYSMPLRIPRRKKKINIYIFLFLLFFYLYFYRVNNLAYRTSSSSS